jgi:hypothetical protein
MASGTGVLHLKRVDRAPGRGDCFGYGLQPEDHSGSSSRSILEAWPMSSSPPRAVAPSVVAVAARSSEETCVSASVFPTPTGRVR